MATPLHLFIETPNDWTLATPYGRNPQNADDFSEALILSSSTSSGRLLAVMNGRLSVRAAAEGKVDADTPLDFPDDGPLPQQIVLFLEPSFGDVLGRANAFRNRLQPEFPGVSFRYIVDASTLDAAIGTQLDAVPMGAGTPVGRPQLLRMFLNGLIDVQVTAGQEIGRGTHDANGKVLALFGVHADDGSIDPSNFYDFMRDFVNEGQSSVDQLLGFAPSVWPILGATRDQVMLETAAGLFPYAVLQEARRRLTLSRSDWRTIGNNQKAFYRERLLVRVGQPPAGSTAPPFEFNDVDWKNVFQLEAVAEFFVNFREPWDGSQPLDPAANPPTAADPDIGPRDFLNLAGTNATATGTTVVINDPGIDFGAILAGTRSGDVIVLDGDTARASKTFKITATNAGAQSLTVDAAPSLAGAGSWTIKRRMQVVLIDPFGPRSSGPTATVTGVDGNGFATLQLDSAPPQVNAFFDTIYLPADTAPRRTYRILQVNGNQIVVQGSPTLPGSSPWAIQAGLSGDLNAAPGGGPLPYVLGPLRPERGNDHFDGMLFVIYNEQVRFRGRWNSYTSRNQSDPPPQSNREVQSTIDGNRGYDLIAFNSTDDFRNYSLQVANYGQGANVVDLCSHARFFFDPLRRPPDNPGGAVTVDGNGKTLIRIHFTYLQQPGHGAQSQGCVVSFHMSDLRTELVEIFEEEYRALHNRVEDGSISRLRGQTQNRTKAIWATGDADTWGNAFRGKLWLVRPDQLPVGYNRPAGF